jgi:hypothetical protein
MSKIAVLSIETKKMPLFRIIPFLSWMRSAQSKVDRFTVKRNPVVGYLGVAALSSMF